MTKREKFTITIDPVVLKMIRKKKADVGVNQGVLIEFGMKKYINELQFGDNTKKLQAYNELVKEQRKEERKQKR